MTKTKARMRLELDRVELLEAMRGLAWLAPGISVNKAVRLIALENSSPSGESGQGWPTLRATNMRVEAVVRMDGEPPEWPMLLDPKLLVPFLRRARGDVVLLEAEEKGDGKGHRIVFRAAAAELELAAPDFWDFPNPLGMDDKELARVDAEPGWLDVFEFAAIATSSERQRYALTGIRIELLHSPSRLVVVATDGKRLAHATIPVEVQADCEAEEALIPSAFVGACGRLPDVHGPASFRLGDRTVSASFGRVCVSTRQIEGEFPPWREIMPVPGDMPHRYRIDRKEFADRVALVQAAVADLPTTASKGEWRGAFPIRCRFEPNEIELLLLRHGAGHRSRVQLDADRLTDDDLKECGFSATFLREGLEALEGNEITWGLGGRHKPSVLSDDRGYVYVVMPMDLGD